MGKHRGNMEGKNDALREEKDGGKEMGAWLLRKAHLAAWHGDTGWGGGARRIDLKTRGGHIEGNKEGKDGALREEKRGGKEMSAWLLRKSPPRRVTWRRRLGPLRWRVV